MKNITTKNLASAAMLVIFSPFLLLSILVSVRTAGVVGNDTLLLLLTLSGAVLSGINGFGRRTAKPARVANVRPSGDDPHSNIPWSTHPSTNA